jgi:hypothetical protein
MTNFRQLMPYGMAEIVGRLIFSVIFVAFCTARIITLGQNSVSEARANHALAIHEERLWNPKVPALPAAGRGSE